jgi:hypothetical protein
MARLLAKLLTGFFMVALLLVFATLVLTLTQPPPAPPALPKPNGYDDLVAASRMLDDSTLHSATMSEADLRVLVRKNADALKTARTGLRRVCQVPLDYPAPRAVYINTNTLWLGWFAQALAAEAHVLELDGRRADAAEAYLTAIRLGGAVGHGGLVVDTLTGTKIEETGTAGLEKLLPALDARECREAVAVLESCDAQREPMATVLARENAWMRRSLGVIKWPIARVMYFRSLRQFDRDVAAKVNARQIREHVLLIKLASRAYELETGRPPKNPAELVPTYLKAIPRNPTTGTDMSYP